MSKLRKDLSAQGLVTKIREKFDAIIDFSNGNISLTDCLTSGLAIFGLKFPSLLQFDLQRKDIELKQNLLRLYGIKNIPSDTYLRERLDEVEAKNLRAPFKQVFSLLQRGKVLEHYSFIDNHYLLALDGTGQYFSNKVHCENCCEKHHKDGRVSYYHQLLGAVMVHPRQKHVIPLAPEPITKADGHTKNDCEGNAAKRLLPCIRKEHPHLKLIIVEDALASNGPHIKLIESLNMQYIIGVKPDSHEYLFDYVNNSEYMIHEDIDLDKTKRVYKFVNNAPLNDTHHDLKVNFLEYWEYPAKGPAKHFSWVTGFKISTENVRQIMEGGRAKWKIENETFNTLKNQGYEFEHNFGHGNKNLCSVFSMLMMLAFLVDQTQNICCYYFKKARKVAGSNKVLWNDMRFLFRYFTFDCWQDLYSKICLVGGQPIVIDTS
jgi:hypothetical protein